VIAVHNGSAHIGAALASVHAQTVQVDEIIVVDDGSIDDTASVAGRAAPSARLLRQPRLGPAAARNAAVAAAHGDLIATLDHDDTWPADRTGALLEGIGTAAFVCGRVAIEAGDNPDPRLLRADRTHIPFLLPTGLMARSAWLALGGMDEALTRAEDIDLYLRLIEAKYQVAYVDAVTLNYRLGPGGLSRNLETSHAAMLEVFRRGAARRRLQVNAGR
jgi:glycosyltransferase involved in cell wall biosynthesis